MKACAPSRSVTLPPVWEAQAAAFSKYAKARYAQFLGVATLSKKQEEEMWDGMSRAWARYVGLVDGEGALFINA